MGGQTADHCAGHSAAAPLPLLLAAFAASSTADAAWPLSSQACGYGPCLLNCLLRGSSLHSGRLLLWRGSGWLRCSRHRAARTLCSQPSGNRPRLLNRLLRCCRLHSGRLLRRRCVKAAAAAPKPWLLPREVERLLGDGHRRRRQRGCWPEVLGQHDFGLGADIACHRRGRASRMRRLGGGCSMKERKKEKEKERGGCSMQAHRPGSSASCCSPRRHRPVMAVKPHPRAASPWRVPEDTKPLWCDWV